MSAQGKLAAYGRPPRAPHHRDDMLFMVRLSRAARRERVEPGGTQVAAFARLIAHHPELEKLISDLNKAYGELVVSLVDTPTAELAYAAMLDHVLEWDKLRAKMGPGTRDLQRAVDAHIGSRLAFVAEAAGELGSDVPSLKTVLAVAAEQAPLEGTRLLRRVRRRLTGPQLPKSQARAGAELLRAVVRHVPDPEQFWADINALIATQVAKGTAAGDIVTMVQGAIAERLGVRLAVVQDQIERDAIEAMQRLVGENPVWVKPEDPRQWWCGFVSGPVGGPTHTGGYGQLYDGSLWLLREDPPTAILVLAIEVKSAYDPYAIAQICRDVSRERGWVRIGDGRYLISPSPEHEVRRLFLAPRPPSSYRIRTGLLPGVAVEYAQLPLTHRQLRELATAVVEAFPAPAPPPP